MKRREFITLLGGAATWPLAARAQQVGGLPRVVYLTGGAIDDQEILARRAAFRLGFEKLGWIDGRNVRIDYHWGQEPSAQRRQALAAELVSSAPNAIMISGTPMSMEFQRITRTIPIVFVNATDPLGSGLVASMAEPGGNLTGFANYLFSTGGKWAELLKEAAPGIKRVLVIMGPGNSGQQGTLEAIEAAAPKLGIQVETVVAPGSGAADIERAIDTFAQQPNGGLLALPGNPGRDNHDLIIRLASRHRLPAMYTYRFATTAGGLMSYDTDSTDLYRRAAFYVDRILKGEKPGNLPVQLPTKYDLVVNLRTAKALGLNIPLALLASADEVIE
jgi:ABC-type uncharacterized transport system substrate-binding protein